MNDKTRAILRRALNLIEGEWPEDDEIAQSVINEIREALEQSVSQEPIAEVKVQKIEGGPAFHYIDCQHLPPGTKLYLAPQPDMNLSCKSVQKRLAASWGYVQTVKDEVELADDDIWEILETHSTDVLKAARAVIAKYKEKNKCQTP